jgi:hypothetical protein
MVQGHPPSHAKPSQTGITVDLEAERIEPSKPGTDDTVAREEPDFAPEEPVTAPEDAATADAQLQPEPDAEEIAPPPTDQSQATRSQAAPQGSSLGAIAAGVFGGLVALFGAGSMQYAGYLPGIGPQAATTATAPATDYAADISALAARLDALPAASSGQTPVDLAPLEARIAALESSVAGLAAPGASASPEMLATIKALQDKIASLSSGLNTVSTGLSEAQQKLEAPKEEVNVARTIAASALKTSIDRGGAFVSELQTLSGVTPEDANLKQLETYAQAGVLSRADLAAAFPAVADSIFAAINAPAEGATLTDRLVSSAMSLVTVRPVGQVDGEGPEAVIARIEAYLQNGDLKAAEVEWNNLPEVGKTAGRDFKTRLDTRIAVESLMTAIMTDAVTVQKVQP